MTQTTNEAPDYGIMHSNASIALKASAGSGKTFALTTRFLRLVFKGEDINRILCITFTNKAALEMQYRILEYLRVLAKGEYDIADKTMRSVIKEVFEIEELTTEIREDIRIKAERVYLKILDNFSGFRVQTIDSFLNSVLRLFPIEADVYPDFQVADETVYGHLKQEALRDFLEALGADETNRKLLADFYDHIIKKTRNPRDYFRDYFYELLNHRIFLEKHNTVADTALRLPEQEFRQKEKELDEALALFKEDKEDRIKLIKKASKDDDSAVGIKTTAGDYYRALSKYRTRFYLYFYFLYLRRLDDRLKREGVYGFEGIKRLCYTLLSEQNIDRAFFYYRLDFRIKHLFMDEFQDTDLIQWEILRPIVEELLADGDGSFFYVGDPKQSIYRFRGGVPELFFKVFEQLKKKTNIRDQALPKNYRSAATIVEFINAFFSGMEFFGERYVLQEAEKTGEHGIVHLTLLKKKDKKKSDEEDEEAATDLESKVLQLITHLRNNLAVPYDKIAVLTETGKTLSSIGALLLDNGVPVNYPEKRTLKDNPVVAGLYQFLKFAADPGERTLFYFHNFAAGFLGSVYHPSHSGKSMRDLCDCLGEKGRVIAGIISSAGLVPAEETVHQLLAVMERPAREEDTAFLTDLLTLIRQYESTNGITLSGLAQYLETEGLNRIPPGAKSFMGVNLLTIHKAKGLEFEVVILPELSKEIRYDARQDKYMLRYDENYAVQDIELMLTKDEFAFAPELQALREHNLTKLREDKLNLLYVALTRAKKGLFMLAEVEVKAKEKTKKTVKEKPKGDRFIDLIMRQIFESGKFPHLADVSREFNEDEPPVSVLSPFGEGGMGGFSGEKTIVISGAMENLRYAGEEQKEIFAEGLIPESMQELLGGKGRPPFEYGEEIPFPVTPDLWLKQQYGDAFHSAMELYVKTGESRIAMVAGLYKSYFTPKITEQLQKDFDAVAQSEFFISLQNKYPQRFAEIAFWDDDKTIRLDALFMNEKEAVIVDYKTHEQNEFHNDYVEKMQAYKEAVKAVYGLEAKAYLCYISEGKHNFIEG